MIQTSSRVLILVHIHLVKVKVYDEILMDSFICDKTGNIYLNRTKINTYNLIFALSVLEIFELQDDLKYCLNKG